MNRNCVIYPLTELKKIHPEIFTDDVSLYIDNTNLKEYKRIVSILEQHESKFRRILIVIMSGYYNRDLYDREDGLVTAMKFKGRFSGNARIYCKEIIQDGKKIVMITSHYKKVQKNDNKILNIIKSIKSYNYEIH